MSKVLDNKSETFNLTEIKEFNPGLIYAFDPEASIRDLNEGSNPVECLFQCAGQFEDVNRAYLYAQNQILPMIRDQGIKAVSSNQLLTAINEIHKRIAHTIAKDHKLTAGEFSKKQILRWHPDATIFNFIQYLFAKIQPPKEVDIKAELTAMNVDLLTVEKFVELMHKANRDQTIQLTEHEIQDLSPSTTDPLSRRIQQALYKLAHSFQMNKFKNPELEVINKILTICPKPSKLPELMQKFLEELLSKWQQCNSSDINKVAELAFFAFFQLTEIHPYFNCNGRTATCLLNIILRSLNYPSILIRFPSEREDEKSQYRQAIDNIKTQPQLLINLIKTRLTAGNSYENQGLAQVICKRVEFKQKLIQLTEYLSVKNLNECYKEWDNNPAFNEYMLIHSQLDDYSKSKDSRLASSILEKYNQLMKAHNQPQITDFSISAIENEGVCFFLGSFLQKAEALRKKLTLSVSPVIKRQYSLKEKKDIVDKLVSLTGQQEGWKTYNNNGALAIFLTLKLEDEELANNIVIALNKTGALKATLKRESKKPGEPGTQKPVIQLTDIQIGKLATITALPNLTIKPQVKEVHCLM